jgi:flagellar biosynthetic protein FliQ
MPGAASFAVRVDDILRSSPGIAPNKFKPRTTKIAHREKSMEEADIADLMRLTFMVILKLSGPLLGVALVVGLVVAMLQAVTQINEATLVFIPKVLGIGTVLLFLGVSMYGTLADFTRYLIDRMVATGGS